MTPFEQQLKKHFVLFLAVIWKYLSLPPTTPIQKDIANYLQYSGKRIVVMAFRGVGKSFITAAFCLWLIYRNPQIKILVVSATRERSDAFSIFCKNLLLDVPILNFLIPSKEQRYSNIAFDVRPAITDQSPTVKSVGISGQLTGSRADLIVSDDVESLSNSATQFTREKIQESVKEYEAILKPLDASKIVFLGTPQVEMSLYNILVTERGYEGRIWPSEFPSEIDILNYKGLLAPFILDGITEDNVGAPTEPDRFSKEDLLERKLSYGKVGYALQYMLNTSLSDADKFPLKCSDFVVYSVGRERSIGNFEHGKSKNLDSKIDCIGLSGDRFYTPLWVDEQNVMPFTGRLMSVDPSGRGKDETAYTVTYMLNGFIFIVEVNGYLGGYEKETLKALALTAAKHKVNVVKIESNFGDGMFSELLKPYLAQYHPCEIIEERQSTSKEQRIIDTIEPLLMQHRLILDPSVIEQDLQVTDKNYSLFYQLTRICAQPKALKHDDRLDSLSINLSYWTDQVGISARDKVQAHEDRLLEEELERFVSHANGRNQSKNTGWLDLSHTLL